MSFEGNDRTGKSEHRIALKLDNVGKSFHVYSRPLHRLIQGFYGERKRLYSEYWALKDISFQVERGETVGIIGRNGAGKSTLLQLICGILTPTAGKLEINGRVAALLELGAGFNPEFTGRENVFLNGAVLGLSQEEIRERFDEIASFADIGDFIDKPVKTYSSGMYIRLAFAVATCVDPDILVVDEALAVGDVKFQAKCFRRFDELVAEGTTILFVTHSTEQIVRHCSCSILLEQGKIREIGDSRKVANHYLELLFGNTGNPYAANANTNKGVGKKEKSDVWLLDDVFEKRSTYNKDEYRWGSGEAKIVDYSVTRDGRGNEASFGGKQPFKVVIAIDFYKDIEYPIFGLTIKTPDGITVSSQNSRDCQQAPAPRSVKEGERLHVIFTVCQYLCSGDYLLSVGVVEERNGELVPLDRRYDSIYLNISNDFISYGLVDLGMQVEIQ